ncbi:MAG: biopolymer transporter ExbD [Candidatus Omnitrophica bacterium]|nr:biopolymer transporter ExbD [Candidatus Omnitrophota bacterium]
MNFRKFIKTAHPFSANLVLPLNIILLAIFSLFLMFFLSVSSKIDIKLPRAVTSDIFNDDNITIILTNENIMYQNGRVVSINDLRGFLSRLNNRKRPILIKVDRRASVGRIVDIWDLGRSLGIERISIATDQGE